MSGAIVLLPNISPWHTKGQPLLPHLHAGTMRNISQDSQPLGRDLN